MNDILAFLIGVTLRFAIPVAATVALVIWFRRLDDRWDAEARRQPAVVLNASDIDRSPRCWEVRQCPPEKMSGCPAHARPGTPCWQVFRSKDGQLREACLGCAIFRDAIIPKVAVRTG